MQSQPTLSSWIKTTSILICLCVLSVNFVDFPFASWISAHQHHRFSRIAFDGPTLCIVLAAVLLLVLVYWSAASQHKLAAETIIIAGCSALVAYGITDLILQPLFGRPDLSIFFSNPDYVRFGRNFGRHDTIFPSGHTGFVTAFSTVLWYHWQALRLLLATSIAIIGVLLTIGSWHFVSDVLGGLVVGITVGTAATAFFAFRRAATEEL